MKWHYACLAFVIAIFTSSQVKAQVCVDVRDSYAVAKNPIVWHQKVLEGKCGVIPNHLTYLWTLAFVNKLRVVELMLDERPKARVFAVQTAPTGLWTVGWAADQNVMPAAVPRICNMTAGIGYCTCCNGAEIVKTKFRVATDGSDAWEYWSLNLNKWLRIPNDVIHWGEKTPTGEGVIFLYPIGSDNVRCFFPPQDGGE